MIEFFFMLSDFYASIFEKLYDATFRFGDGFSQVTSIGAVLFAAIVIGFVVSVYWKGARAQ